MTITKRQQEALRLYRQLGNVSKVAKALNVSRENASRLLSRGRNNLRAFSAFAAAFNGQDPLDALEDVQRVLSLQ